MCGLAGMAGFGMITIDFDAFRDILYMSAMRGPHSTGLMTVNVNNDHSSKHPRIVKRVGPSQYFIMMDQASQKPQLKSFMTDIFLGHCRYSTVGKTTEENAHPFDTGRYVSAHNGTLYDIWSYSKEGEGVTDSLLMFQRMEKYGIKETLESMKEHSAYAISMYDKKDRKIILARNKHRPLYVGISNKRNVMYWASEYGILYCAAMRNNIDMKIFHLVSDKVYTITPSKIKAGNYAPWVVEDIIRKEEPQKTNIPFDVGTASDFDVSDKTLAVPDDSLLRNNPRVTFDLTEINSTGSAVMDDDDPWEDGIAFNPDNGSTYSPAPVSSDLIAGLTAAPLPKSNKPDTGPKFFSDEELEKSYAYFQREQKQKQKDAKKKSNKSVPSVRRSKMIDLVDEITSPRKDQTVDDIMEQIKAEKAIEEAQGVTRTRENTSEGRLQSLKDNYKDFSEECCICTRKLSRKDLDKATATEIDQSWYFSCQSCDEELAEMRARG